MMVTKAVTLYKNMGEKHLSVPVRLSIKIIGKLQCLAWSNYTKNEIVLFCIISFFFRKLVRSQHRRMREQPMYP